MVAASLGRVGIQELLNVLDSPLDEIKHLVCDSSLALRKL